MGCSADFVMLDKVIIPQYNSNNGLVAQLGAHHIRIVGVGSSNLLKSTIERKYELCIL